MLKIGDFSKLSRISVRMLRHYDEIGLLRPVYVDRFTDYRYYDEHQLPTVGRITALKDMGFHLAEIGQLLELYDDKDALDAHLAAQQQQLELLAADTAQRLRLIAAARNRLRKDEPMKYNVTLKTLPERYCATVRMTIPCYEDEGMVWSVLCSETAAMALVPSDPCYCAVEFLDNEFKEQNVEIMASKSVKGTYPDASRRDLRRLHVQGQLRADQRRCRHCQRVGGGQRLRLRRSHVRYLPRQPARDAEPRRVCHRGLLPG